MANGEASPIAATEPDIRSARISDSRLIEFVWAALSVSIFSGWFVVIRLSVTREPQIRDIAALHFGIAAILLAPAILRLGARLPLAAWGAGLVFALLWGVRFVPLDALGLKLTSAALICIWLAVFFVPIYFFFGLSRFALASPGKIALQIVYQDVLMSSMAIVTFNRAVSLLGSSAATAVIVLLAAVAAILAIPVLRETPSLAEATAIAVIVLGVLLASARHPFRKPDGDTHDPLLFPSHA